jgi:sugar phosphate isomerase/epimerase
MTTQPAKGLKLGTTLYSLTTEYHSRKYGFADLIRKVAAEGIGPGLEVVGFQSIRGFPEVSDEFADEFRGLIEETGLVPSCLGINADININRKQPMTDDESVAYHTRQLEAAAKLRFPVARYQYPAGPKVIERLAPVAEKLEVKLGLEIHAPHHSQHPDVLAFREMYERVKSPYLGFIPDMGSTARTVPPSFFEARQASGVPAELLEIAKDYWHRDGDPHEKQDAFIAEGKARGYSDLHIMPVMMIFGLFGRAAPESWAEIIPQCVHIHGKFFDFEDDGEEIAVDWKRVLPVFVNGGYDGYMSSEYEGHMWTDFDGFDRIKRHHAHVSQIMDTL